MINLKQFHEVDPKKRLVGQRRLRDNMGIHSDFTNINKYGLALEFARLKIDFYSFLRHFWILAKNRSEAAIKSGRI